MYVRDTCAAQRTPSISIGSVNCFLHIHPSNNSSTPFVLEGSLVQLWLVFLRPPCYKAGRGNRRLLLPRLKTCDAPSMVWNNRTQCGVRQRTNALLIPHVWQTKGKRNLPCRHTHLRYFCTEAPHQDSLSSPSVGACAESARPPSRPRCTRRKGAPHFALLERLESGHRLQKTSPPRSSRLDGWG